MYKFYRGTGYAYEYGEDLMKIPSPFGNDSKGKYRKSECVKDGLDKLRACQYQEVNNCGMIVQDGRAKSNCYEEAKRCKARAALSIKKCY